MIFRELSLRGRQAVAIPRLLRRFAPRNDNLGPVTRDRSLRAKRSNLYSHTGWEDIRDCFPASAWDWTLLPKTVMF